MDVEERCDCVAYNPPATGRWILAFTGRPNKPLQPTSGADALGRSEGVVAPLAAERQAVGPTKSNHI